MNGLGLSLSFFRQIPYHVNINSKSTRILFILTAVSAYLLYIHYTAYLTAVSTHGKRTQISSFRDVLNGGYQVAVWENTSHHDYLRYSKPGTAMHEVYHLTMKNKPGAFINSHEEIRKVLNSKKTLYYESDLYLKPLHEDLNFLSIKVFMMKL